ncbi:MAG: ImmA/IrrE family metallo-endopeptidase [Candidatus Saccharimonadales bacterium]
MVVTTTSSKPSSELLPAPAVAGAGKATRKSTTGQNAKRFIKQVASDYPQFRFEAGSQEHWSPKSGTITYNQSEPLDELRYGLLHELAHALLGHTTYQSDFELLKLESQAWELAAKIGKKYKIKLDEEHIQDCLDTYRDWLHRRSKCPTCGMHVLQKSANAYQCFNCGTAWRVSHRRFARSYRRRI